MYVVLALIVKPVGVKWISKLMPAVVIGPTVALIGLSLAGNASVVTIIAAAIGCIGISFLSPFVAFVDSIPACVMGGVCVSLYGFIAVSGLKMIQGGDLGKHKNLFVVSVILITGIGGMQLVFGSVTLTSIACADPRHHYQPHRLPRKGRLIGRSNRNKQRRGHLLFEQAYDHADFIYPTRSLKLYLKQICLGNLAVGILIICIIGEAEAIRFFVAILLLRLP